MAPEWRDFNFDQTEVEVTQYDQKGYPILARVNDQTVSVQEALVRAAKRAMVAQLGEPQERVWEIIEATSGVILFGE